MAPLWTIRAVASLHSAHFPEPKPLTPARGKKTERETEQGIVMKQVKHHYRQGYLFLRRYQCQRSIDEVALYEFFLFLDSKAYKKYMLVCLSQLLILVCMFSSMCVLTNVFVRVKRWRKFLKIRVPVTTPCVCSYFPLYEGMLPA